MGNYEVLKAAISAVIKSNGNNDITGTILQNSLLTMITSISSGSTFMGVATTTTNPGTPDGNVFFLASIPGTYSNFNSLTVSKGEIAIFTNKTGSWVKIVAYQNTKYLDYMYLASDTRYAAHVDGGYFDFFLDAYIPLTTLVASNFYYFSLVDRVNKTFALYRTTGETGIFVCNFTENSSIGDLSIMKTSTVANAWVIVDWTKLKVDSLSGYRAGTALNPRIFKNPNIDYLLTLINTANNNISTLNTGLNNISKSINQNSILDNNVISRIGFITGIFETINTITSSYINEYGNIVPSSQSKSTVLKLKPTGVNGNMDIFLSYTAFNIANAYYVIKDQSGNNLLLAKPTSTNAVIQYSGNVNEIWIVVSNLADMSYSGLALGGEISTDNIDLSSISNTVIDESILIGLLIRGRFNTQTKLIVDSNAFKTYTYIIPTGCNKIKLRLSNYPNAGMGIYDSTGTVIATYTNYQTDKGNGDYVTIDVPNGAVSLINSVQTSEVAPFNPFTPGDLTFIFSNNMETRINERIDIIDGEITELQNKNFISTFPKIANFTPPKKNIDEPIKILFIGSSWLINTYWYLNKITNAAGINAIIKTAFIAGGSFSQWINAYNNNQSLSSYYSSNGSDWTSTNTTLLTLFSEEWDIVCFQQGALVGRLWSNYENYWSDWVSIIRRNINSKCILCFNATWTPAINVDGIYTPEKLADLSPYTNDRSGQLLWQIDNNTNIAKFVSLAGLNSYISPCGAAVFAARRNTLLKDDNHDLADDGIHLNSGMPAYIPAATWYETFIAPIYGISIDTITWIPDENTQKCAVSWDNYTAMTEDHRVMICKIVKLAASDRLGYRSL